MRDLVLASSSPRRRELLAGLGLAFRIAAADVDETPHRGEGPLELVRRLADAKAIAVAGDPVISADTIVEVDGTILSKPADAADARRMLRQLSGRTHRVHTGVAVRSGGRRELEVVTTEVTFAPLGAPVIAWYVASGEPFDKAGAYAIQGRAGAFVASVHGSVSNVIGLPLATVVAMLADLTPWTLGQPSADEDRRRRS